MATPSNALVPVDASAPWYNAERVAYKGSAILTHWTAQRQATRAARLPRVPGRRNYAAAALTRLTASWGTSSNSANADIYRHLSILIARSRDLVTNNPYGRKFVGMCKSNIIGPQGVVLQAGVLDAPGVPDTGANNAIEAAWDAWCARGVCDVTGQHTFRDMCNLMIAACARDGAYLAVKVRGKAAGNSTGLALQLLDVDRIDTQLQRAAGSGINAIRMGVEINAYGRPAALWLKTVHPGDMWAADGQASAKHQRIPIEDVFHGFIADRPEQLRGVPWMHAAMTQLNNLGGFEEAAIIASRVGASKMGFFTNDDPAGPPLDPTKIADGVDEATGIPYTDADPGTFGTLPPGYKFESFDPDYPSAMFGPFVKAALRGAASGLDVSYNSLGNDLEGVNFSSIRAGVLEERELWMDKQKWFIDAFVEPLYQEWLLQAVGMGQILLANGSPLPVAKLDKFRAHTWQPRRWSWVDPVKDIESARLEIQTGVASPQMIAARNGVDVEDVLDQIGQFEERLKAKKITSVNLAASQGGAGVKPGASPSASDGSSP
jgi:lambda family phage portal protein